MKAHIMLDINIMLHNLKNDIHVRDAHTEKEVPCKIFKHIAIKSG